jgi:hypothetical protein
MSMEQVSRFVGEVKRSRPLGLISVMGGEPTLHPHLGDVLSLLRVELLEKGHVREIRIATNGETPLPVEAEGVPVYVSRPADKKHRCQLAAPVDTGQPYRRCSIPFKCGISLNRFGYAPCGAGGAIARLFDLPFTRYQLPSSVAEFGNLLPLCRLCQLGAIKRRMVRDYGNEISESFAEALDNWEMRPLRDY